MTGDYAWGETASFANSTVHQCVKCAAILYQGRVYEGLRHDLIGHRMLAEGVCPRPFPGGPAQGFVTGVGCFVDRKTALIIAVNAGQVKFERCSAPPNLYSEDLIRARFLEEGHKQDRDLLDAEFIERAQNYIKQTNQ